MSLGPAYRELLAPGRRWLLIAAGGASFIAASDLLLVATALPSAARDLNGLDHYALVVGCYAAALAVGLPISGAIIDRYGAWHSLVVGCALFVVAGIAAPFAPTMEVIAGLRLVQGFGAGFLLAVPLSVVVQRIPAHLRTSAFALSNSVWALAALAGPVFGAVLTDLFSWRAAFVVPPMMTLGVVYAGYRGLRDPTVRPANPQARIHPLGPVLLGVTIAALLLDPRFAVVPAIGFVVSEWRSSEPVFHVLERVARSHYSVVRRELPSRVLMVCCHSVCRLVSAGQFSLPRFHWFLRRWHGQLARSLVRV